MAKPAKAMATVTAVEGSGIAATPVYLSGVLAKNDAAGLDNSVA